MLNQLHQLQYLHHYQLKEEHLHTHQDKHTQYEVEIAVFESIEIVMVMICLTYTKWSG